MSVKKLTRSKNDRPMVQSLQNLQGKYLITTDGQIYVE